MLNRKWYWVLLFLVSMVVGVVVQLFLLYNYFFDGQTFVEVTTTLFVVSVIVAGLVFKKNKQAEPLLFAAKAVVVGFALVYLLGLFYFLMHDRGVREMEVARAGYYQKNEAKFLPLVTSLMDKAEKVNVRSDIDKMYNTEFGYRQEDGTYKGRQPVYFVRLKNDKLEKLFQAGDIKEEVIDSQGEKWVAEMLQGKRQLFEFPQYTCCGGDDIFPEAPFLRHLLPERRYLKDFRSEIEIIIPLRDSGGEIKGAIVSLHGD